MRRLNVAHPGWFGVGAIVGNMLYFYLISGAVNGPKVKPLLSHCDTVPALTRLVEDMTSSSPVVRATAVDLVTEHLERCGLRVVRSLPHGRRNQLYAMIRHYDTDLARVIATQLIADPDPEALPWIRQALKNPFCKRFYSTTHQLYAECEQALIAAAASANHPAELLRGSTAPQDHRTLLQPAQGVQQDDSQVLMRAARKSDDSR
jgi:hypothetical protein